MAKRVSQARFNAFTIGTRNWRVFTLVREVSWFSNENESLFGAVCFDFHDSDYHWILLARDEKMQFRWVDGCASIVDLATAEIELCGKIDSISSDQIASGFGNQSDKDRQISDLVEPIPRLSHEKMHPYFYSLANDPALLPAKSIIREMSRWLIAQDPHFKQEFQIHQFDQRIWEIYIWAVLKEVGFEVNHATAPDFLCSGFGFSFTVEATTMGPSKSGALAGINPPTNPHELAEYQQGYLPMKFAQSLTSKLNKKHQGMHYWELPEAQGQPFIIAIADFHSPGSMTYSQGSLHPYLYGSQVDKIIKGGVSVVKYKPITAIEFRDKSIPAGFFKLPNAEYVSAILFSNAGTLPKFNRMGIAAGFTHSYKSMNRVGRKYNLDPNSIEGTPFTADVLSSDYKELWRNEVVIYHNPNAIHPIPLDALPDLLHVLEADGRIFTVNSDGKIISSITNGVLVMP